MLLSIQTAASGRLERSVSSTRFWLSIPLGASAPWKPEPPWLFRTLILFDPEKKTGVVALWNSNTGRPTGLQFEFLDLVYDLPFRDWLELDR